MSTVQFSRTTRDGLPPWVLSFVGRTVQERGYRSGPHDVTAVDGEYGLVATVHVRDALGMSADELTAATTSAYGSIRNLITARPELRTLRLWNFIPGILDPVDGLPHRYMAFNAGRFAAIREWSATDGDVTGWMPTASGVGSNTPDLVIHALAGAGTARARRASRAPSGSRPTDRTMRSCCSAGPRAWSARRPATPGTSRARSTRPWTTSAR